ncbi:hypothetical protein E2C01_101087 [Portunus trituberculatus]|uniref:Uncharacterized protein n=1 Tax=Portunus trituberculatus TaxID=210409 RepID=A0A5B7KJ63_PORTR|nr:hypothetical protein [Portunus trituberculatus]
MNMETRHGTEGVKGTGNNIFPTHNTKTFNFFSPSHDFSTHICNRKHSPPSLPPPQHYPIPSPSLHHPCPSEDLHGCYLTSTRKRPALTGLTLTVPEGLARDPIFLTPNERVSGKVCLHVWKS